MNKTLNSGQTPAANWNSTRVHVLGTAHWVLGALVMSTCVGSIMGNGLVVWLLGFHGQRGPYKVCILHLAVADLLVLQAQPRKHPTGVGWATRGPRGPRGRPTRWWPRWLA